MRNLAAIVVLLIGAALAATAASAPRIRLQENVTVAGTVIALCDLLPADAPAGLHSASCAVSLDAAPEPGSPRVFEKADLEARLASHPELIRQLLLPERVRVHRASWPISREGILRAIAESMPSSSPGQLTFSDPSSPAMRALRPNPTLVVSRSAWDPRQRALLFHLRCLDRRDCGSFLVEVHANSPASPSSRPPALRPAAFTQPAPNSVDRPAGPALIRAGDSALLVLEDGGIRFSLPVVCLQRGARGQRIRVRSAAGRRIFLATIVSRNKLEAAF